MSHKPLMRALFGAGIVLSIVGLIQDIAFASTIGAVSLAVGAMFMGDL